MVKCDHKKCINEAEHGSPFCKDCVQLPTIECNFCNLGGANPSKDRKLAEEIAKQQRPLWRKILGK